ncbi:MAG TPA: arylesterase, partial [Deltaproteobacteria bacterium]|nr:arylesterase [Deltaproteobacteria bacterium]
AEIRILALGDSLTEGYGVEPEEAYPYLLEQLLKEEGLEARVINGGF